MTRLKKIGWVPGLALGGLLAFGFLLACTPADRRACERSGAEICGEGTAVTVVYSGMAGFSTCRRQCGDEPGPITFVDRSWPFGRDR